LYRSNELHEAEIKFLQVKDKVPLLVGISREVSIFSHTYTRKQIVLPKYSDDFDIYVPGKNALTLKGLISLYGYMSRDTW
jgi:hypothetical protein